jgi:hypothetical protein
LGWLIEGAMSRYYFHIRDGVTLVPDEEGIECRNMVAVLNEAHASALDLAQAALRSFTPRIPANIEVEDEDGNALGVAGTNLAIN